MAALELTVSQWSAFLADESLDIEIEGVLVEDPLGQEFDYLDEDFSAYLADDSTLKLHDGVVLDHSVNVDPVCLKKFVKGWLDKRCQAVEEMSKKPTLYIVFDDEVSLKKVENVLNSLKVNLGVNMAIQPGAS